MPALRDRSHLPRVGVVRGIARRPRPSWRRRPRGRGQLAHDAGARTPGRVPPLASRPARPHSRPGFANSSPLHRPDVAGRRKLAARSEVAGRGGAMARSGSATVAGRSRASPAASNRASAALEPADAFIRRRSRSASFRASFLAGVVDPFEDERARVPARTKKRRYGFRGDGPIPERCGEHTPCRRSGHTRRGIVVRAIGLPTSFKAKSRLHGVTDSRCEPLEVLAADDARRDANAGERGHRSHHVPSEASRSQARRRSRAPA
jgi:hypothetical protein